MALDIDLADRVGERAAGRLRWRGARAGAAAAGRRGCGRRRRSADRHRPAAARAAKRLAVWKASQSFQASSGSLRDQSGEAADWLGVPGDDLVLAAELGGVEEGVPVDARGAGGEFGAGPGLHAVRILRGDRVGMGAGDLGFEVEDALGARLRRRACPSASASGRYRRGSALRTWVISGVVGEIIIAVGQAEAALQQIGACCGPAAAGPGRRTRRTDSRCRSWSRSAGRRRRACWRRARRKAAACRRSPGCAASCGWSGAAPRASIAARSR